MTRHARKTPPAVLTVPRMSPGPQSTRAADDDIAAMSPPILVRISAGVAALAGLTVMFCGLQLFMLSAEAGTGMAVRYGLLRGVMGGVPYFFIILGLVTGAMGVPLLRARTWGAVAVTAVAGLLALLGAGWLAYSAARGLFSLMALA